MALKRLGRFAGAITLYEHVTQLLEQDTGTDESLRSRYLSSVYSNMANAYLAIEKPDEAIRLCDVALGYDARNGLAWTNKAVAHCQLGK